MRRLLILLVATGVLGVPPAAAAGKADETALAERYAPVVRLVADTGGCETAKPYVPIDIDRLLGDPTVALRGPWGGGDLVSIGPTATELSKGLFEYHLDFPGNALDPGCGYLHWQERLFKGETPVVYAHVATQPSFPDKLALQYWFFYVFNDWNNLHEGDWETVQLVFDASTPAEALKRPPVAIGYSQHEGAERAAWQDDKLERLDGTHPVVHPAAGSHANFFGDALYLGSSAEEGVGCDDTRGPTFDVRPIVRTIPNDQAEAGRAFPWIGFEGRWGELRPAFFNGPTGPNLKSQWSEPISWSQGWRDRAYTVPVGSAFGPAATDFFCGAVGKGSRALVSLVHRPLEFSLVLGALVLLLIVCLTRTTWRPTAPVHVARRRAWGQILSSSWRMYVRRLPLFLGIGALLLPISWLVILVQTLVLHATSFAGVQTVGENNGLVVFFGLALSTALTLLGLGFVQAATARALVEIDRERPVGPLHAYRMAFDCVRPLFGALLIAASVVSLLVTSLFLIPLAVWLAGRWSLIAPTIELEDVSAFGALRRSGRLIRGRWLKAASLLVVGGAIVLGVGPILGVLLILVTNAPFWLVNVIAGLVYAVTMPFLALTTTYVYFDLRVRNELAPADEPDELPAEIGLPA